MLHIELERHKEGLISIKGCNLEIMNDFANLVHYLYTEAPDIYLILLSVIEDHAKEIIKEEEAKRNDKNNSSN